MKKIRPKKKITGVLATLAFLVAVAVPVISNPKPASAWECKSRNVITCGVNNRTELVNAIRTDANLNYIFDEIGIYADDVASVDTVSGVVKKDGSVWVGNTQVASGTVMGQRGNQDIENISSYWGGLYWAYTNQMFSPTIDQQGAFVYMRNGQFLYAIVLSCGNPVIQGLKPFPPGMSLNKNVRNITADPNSNFAKSVDANPGDTIEFRIEVKDISQVTVEDIVVSDALPAYMALVPDSGHAQVLAYTDGAWKEQDIAVTNEQLASGKTLGNFRPEQNSFIYLRATVNEDVPDGCSELVNTGSAKASQIRNITSTASVKVCKETPPPPPPPPTPTPTPSQPTSLPVSGPVEAAAGVMGTGALGYAGYMWRRSRKTLLDTLKRQ